MCLVYNAAGRESNVRHSGIRCVSPGSTRRRRKTDRVPELLGPGADHDERDVIDLDPPEIDDLLVCGAEDRAEPGDRLPVELVPALELVAELRRRLELPHRLRLRPQDG